MRSLSTGRWQSSIAAKAASFFVTKNGRSLVRRSLDDFVSRLQSHCSFLPRDPADIWASANLPGNNSWTLSMVSLCVILISTTTFVLFGHLDQIAPSPSIKPANQAASKSFTGQFPIFSVTQRIGALRTATPAYSVQLGDAGCKCILMRFREVLRGLFLALNPHASFSAPKCFVHALR